MALPPRPTGAADNGSVYDGFVAADEAIDARARTDGSSFVDDTSRDVFRQSITAMKRDGSDVNMTSDDKTAFRGVIGAASQTDLEAVENDLSQTITDAPNDGQLYARGSGQWLVAPDGTTLVFGSVSGPAEPILDDYPTGGLGVGARAEVRTDPDDDLNGVYSWDGADWLRISDLLPAGVEAAVLKSVRFEVLDEDSYESGAILALLDDNDGILATWDLYDAKMRAVMDAEAFDLTLETWQLDPQIAYDRGARGVVTDVRPKMIDDKLFYTYRTSAVGGARVIVPDELMYDEMDRPDYYGHILDEGDEVECFWTLGQSYAAKDYPTLSQYVGEPSFETALTLHTSSPTQGVGPLQSGAGTGIKGPLTGITGFDVRGYVGAKGTEAMCNTSYTRAAQESYIRFCKRYGRTVKPTLIYDPNYPGSNWTGGGDTSGDINPRTGLPYLTGLRPGGKPWEMGLQMREAQEAFCAEYGKSIRYIGMGFLFGEPDLSDLQDMKVAVNDLDPDGPPQKLFGGEVVMNNGGSIANGTNANIANFCRITPDVYLATQLYPYSFESIARGDDVNSPIHPSGWGITRAGVLYGYAVFCVYKLPAVAGGGTFRPLELTEPDGSEIEWSGNTITIPLNRPTGPAFASGALKFYSLDMLWPFEEPIYGSVDPMKPDKGFNIQRSGVDMPISSIVLGQRLIEVGTVEFPRQIAQLCVTITMVNPLQAGDHVLYAWIGDAVQPPDGTFARIRGNVCIEGANDPLDPSLKMRAYLHPFDVALT